VVRCKMVTQEAPCTFKKCNQNKNEYEDEGQKFPTNRVCRKFPTTHI